MKTIKLCPKGHEYSIVGKSKSGHCLQCKRDYWREKHPKPIKQQLCKRGHDRSQLELGTVCPECSKITSTKWNSENPNSKRESCWRRAGIINKDCSPFTVIDFDRNYQVQQGRCKICKKHQSELPTALHVDHDHRTGFFRGLLCWNCNKSIGYYELIKIKAEEYLGAN